MSRYGHKNNGVKWEEPGIRERVPANIPPPQPTLLPLGYRYVDLGEGEFLQNILIIHRQQSRQEKVIILGGECWLRTVLVLKGSFLADTTLEI